jgi:N-acetylmuramoyl-L-alanine amidase
MRHIKYIFLHCTAGYLTINQLLKYFRSKDWDNPGYHIEIDEKGHQTQLLNFAQIANGVRGYNGESIHIAYRGGVNYGHWLHWMDGFRDAYPEAEDTRTIWQKRELQHAIYKALNWCNIYQDIDDIKILGHRDISPDTNGNGIVDPWERLKECPSFDAIPEYGWITKG